MTELPIATPAPMAPANKLRPKVKGASPIDPRVTILPTVAVPFDCNTLASNTFLISLRAVLKFYLCFFLYSAHLRVFSHYLASYLVTIKSREQ